MNHSKLQIEMKSLAFINAFVVNKDIEWHSYLESLHYLSFLANLSCIEREYEKGATEICSALQR